MSTKYVRETQAGKSLSAWVILSPRKNSQEGPEIIAKMLAHYGASRVLVNVWTEHGAPEEACRQAKSAFTGDYVPNMNFQHGQASGYGYDKFTAALSGLYIDGHKMADHCEQLPKDDPSREVIPEGFEGYPSDFQPPKGYRTANLVGKHPNHKWDSCFKLAGLKYLEALRYTVIQVL